MRMETTSAAGLVFEAKSSSNAIVGTVPTLVPVDLTKYKLETLREDGELVFHRGRSMIIHATASIPIHKLYHLKRHLLSRPLLPCSGSGKGHPYRV